MTDPMLTRDEIAELQELCGYADSIYAPVHLVPCTVVRSLVMALALLDVLEAWQRYQRGDLSREEFEATVAVRCPP